MKKTLLLFGFALIVGLSACKDPVPVNEEEIITTLTLSFQEIDLSNNAVGTPFSASWADADGDGGNDPVVDGITLKSGSRYKVSLKVLNETVSPADDITTEVQAEGEDHQFFYTLDNPLMLAIGYTDQDAAGHPIGIATVFEAGSVSSGLLTVTLRHLPNKTAEGVSTGDITNAGGETDMETVPPFSLDIIN